METTRRWILLVAVSAALFFVFFASLKPYLTVEPVDMAAAQKDESRWTERGQYLAQLPLDEYIAEATRGQRLDVSGPDWEKMLSEIRRASVENPLPPSWRDRVSKSEHDQAYYPRQVHFSADEPPLAGLAHGLKKNGQQAYLVLTTGAGPPYFSLTYHAFTSNDFGFGSGLSHLPKPPARIFRPLRRYSLPILFLGLAAYIFLPWPRRKKDALQYQRWRIVLGDFASFLLFVPFFTLPMLVLGGAVQGLTQGWILAAVVWPLAFAGVWLLFHNGRLAEFCLSWTAAGLSLRTGRAVREIPFSGLSHYQPLVLKPPKWLIIASWLGALAGRGSARAGSAGRALILGGTAYGGLGLGLKDGSGVFLWITDQLGGDAVGGAGRLVKALDAAGVTRREEVRTFTGITEPEGEDAQGKRLRRKSDRVLAVLLLTPFLFMILGVILLTGLGRSSRSGSGRAPDAEKKPEPVSFAASDGGSSVAWQAVLSLGDITVIQAAIPDGAGGVLAGGHCSVEGANVDAYLARLDAGGRLLWQSRYGSEMWEYVTALAAAPGGGFLAAGESRPETSFEGGTKVFLVKIDAAGKSEWEKTLGPESPARAVFAVRSTGGGGFEILGSAGPRLFVWTVDDAGEVIKSLQLDPEESRELRISHAVWTADEGVAATGEIINPGIGYKDLWLARFDASGAHLWTRAYGGPKKESGAWVAALPDGGLIAAGLTESSGAGGSDAYLVRVDARGEMVWEKAFGTGGEEAAVRAAVDAGGGILAAGFARPAEGAPARAYVLRLGADGSLVQERTFGSGASFEGAAVVPEADGDIVAANATAGYFFQTTAGVFKIRR
jgi:hypothetical protein